MPPCERQRPGPRPGHGGHQTGAAALELRSPPRAVALARPQRADRLRAPARRLRDRFADDAGPDALPDPGPPPARHARGLPRRPAPQLARARPARDGVRGRLHGRQLAAWIVASRKDDWQDLLAATFVTVAIAVPVLLASAAVETWVSPHLLHAIAS